MSVHQLSLPHLGQGRERAPRAEPPPADVLRGQDPAADHDRRALAARRPHRAVPRPSGVAHRDRRRARASGQPLRRRGHARRGPVIVRIVSDEAAVRKAQPLRGVVHLATGDFLRSPAAEARRAVWASRGAPVAAADRWAVLSALAQAQDGLTLAETVASVRADAREGVEAVCALACEGLIALDLERGLTPESRVRRHQPP